MQAQAVADANPFVAAREHFEDLITRLGAEETCRMTHAEVERLLEADGREVIRRLFQGHLDARGAGEATAAVVGADGQHRTHVRVSDRELATVFGPVRVARIGYGQRGVVSLFPRDAELNLPPEIHSHGVRRRVAEEAARGSFDEAVQAMARTTGADVAKTTGGTIGRAGGEGLRRVLCLARGDDPGGGGQHRADPGVDHRR